MAGETENRSLAFDDVPAAFENINTGKIWPALIRRNRDGQPARHYRPQRRVEIDVAVDHRTARKRGQKGHRRGRAASAVENSEEVDGHRIVSICADQRIHAAEPERQRLRLVSVPASLGYRQRGRMPSSPAVPTLSAASWLRSGLNSCRVLMHALDLVRRRRDNRTARIALTPPLQQAQTDGSRR